MERRKISYEKDLVKDIVPNIDEDRKLELVKHIFGYIASETDKDESFAIKLPKVGVLYCSELLQKNKSKSNDKEFNKYQKLKMLVDEAESKTKHTYMPNSFISARRLYKDYNLTTYKNYIRMDRQYLECLAAIEEIQNNKESKFNL
jgi:hypothetical protein